MTVYDEKDLSLLAGNLRGHYAGIAVGGGDLCKSGWGMAVCLLLFYVVNPIYSVVIGVFAGKDRKHLGSLPVVSAVLFLIGTWLFFGMGEPAFIRYGVIYLALGIGAMAISSIVRKKKK